jgi:hypothetical protein
MDKLSRETSAILYNFWKGMEKVTSDKEEEELLERTITLLYYAKGIKYNGPSTISREFNRKR